MFILSCNNTLEKTYEEWRIYGNDGNSRYSSLTQINTGNADQLTVAWTFSTNESDSNNMMQLQCSPIMVNGLLYLNSAKGKVFCVNASTGMEVWHFDALYDSTANETSRGVVYWESSDKTDRRIFFSARSFLYAIHADNGGLKLDFGDSGKIDLRKGLDRELSSQFVISTTPGVICNNLLIQGSRVHEGPGKSAPGHIRAFDVITGKQVWIFHTIPHPGEFGYETWPPDAWQKIGGANAWAGMTVDTARKTVFVPLGSPSYDFYGADRKGQGLFGNSLVALDVNTGKRKWHYQTIHHDLWDRDLPSPPNLVTIKKNGKTVDAVAQVTKTGYIFIFNRDTGEPIFPIEEQPVPQSIVPGEQTWPTQPHPTKPEPFIRQLFADDDISTISPETYENVKNRLTGVKRSHMFEPPSLEGTMILPGFDGGGEWGGAAYDDHSGILYVNANEMAWILRLIPKAQGGNNSPGRTVYINNCAACHGMNLQGSTGQFPSLDTIEKKLDSSAIAEQLMKGKGRMPAFSHLPGYQVKNLIAYLLKKEKKTDPNDHRAANVDENDDLPEYIGTGYNRFYDMNGYPAISPPWGTLNAIDLSAGKIVWSVPLGEFPELTARGIPRTGTENYGGPVVTSGGVIFIGASKDEKFRVFDKKTGKVLWETKLPAGGYATPCTYMVDGRQYVVIAAGGGKMGTKSGNLYIAFSLPQKK
jgi:quinoprotein glucose dehydrogenase